jgi:hypothetical protein
MTQWQCLLAETPAAFPHGAALSGWVGRRCAQAIGDDAAAAVRATLALDVVERWIGNGAEALPVYLIEPVRHYVATAHDPRQPAQQGW